MVLDEVVADEAVFVVELGRERALIVVEGVAYELGRGGVVGGERGRDEVAVVGLEEGVADAAQEHGPGRGHRHVLNVLEGVGAGAAEVGADAGEGVADPGHWFFNRMYALNWGKWRQPQAKSWRMRFREAWYSHQMTAA